MPLLSEPGKKIVLVLLLVGVMIAALVVAWVNRPPLPIWGPRNIRSSPIDISVLEPFVDIPKYDLEELEARIESIGSSGGEFRLESRDPSRLPKDERVNILRHFSFTGSPLGGSNLMTASVQVFETSEDIAMQQKWAEEVNILPPPRSESTVLSDDVEVHRTYLNWHRGWSGYHGPIRTSVSIRIHNVLIGISEDASLGDIDRMGALTEDALQQILEALDPPNSPHD